LSVKVSSAALAGAATDAATATDATAMSILRVRVISSPFAQHPESLVLARRP
jgi:hypothetical protein